MAGLITKCYPYKNILKSVISVEHIQPAYVPLHTKLERTSLISLSLSESTGSMLIRMSHHFFFYHQVIGGGGMPLHLVRTDTIPSIMSVLHLTTFLIANEMWL